MTLIGVIVRNKTFFVISDVVLTNLSNFFPEFPIPSLGKISEDLKPYKAKFGGNIEKLYMITLDSIIGFAGDPHHAENFINELNSFDPRKDPSKIQKIMEQYQTKPKFQCICIFKHENDLKIYSTSEIYENLENFDCICSIGSGSKVFKQKISSIDQNFSNFFLNKNTLKFDENTEIELKILFILRIMSDFFKEDFIVDGNSLRNNFGGFYEIIIEHCRSLRKLDGYHLCIWIYRMNKYGLKYLFSPNYQNSSLNIIRLEFTNNISRKSEYSLRVLKDFYKNYEQDINNVNNENFIVEFDCTANIVFFLTDQDKIDEIGFLGNATKMSNSIHLMNHENGKLTYTLDQKFKKNMIELIQAYIKKKRR